MPYHREVPPLLFQHGDPISDIDLDQLSSPEETHVMIKPLQRDMDLIRTLLLDIEGGRRAFEIIGDDIAEALGIDPDKAMPAVEAAKLEYHLDLLADAEFIELERTNSAWWVKTITWKGHEFLETVRDAEVWAKAKEGATKVGNASLSFIWELAKGYGKHLAKERLGIALD